MTANNTEIQAINQDLDKIALELDNIKQFLAESNKKGEDFSTSTEIHHTGTPINVPLTEGMDMLKSAFSQIRNKLSKPL